ncbi:MAG: hypothetical protein ACTHKH_13225, partial [Trinickia sp.]
MDLCGARSCRTAPAAAAAAFKPGAPTRRDADASSKSIVVRPRGNARRGELELAETPDYLPGGRRKFDACRGSADRDTIDAPMNTQRSAGTAGF